MTANGATITMTKDELEELIEAAIAKSAKVETAVPVASAPTPIDLTDYDPSKQHKSVARQVVRFVKGGDGFAPHSFGQRMRLLALSDRRGPDFDDLKNSGMNAITAAVASYWLESGRPVKVGDLVLVPRS